MSAARNVPIFDPPAPQPVRLSAGFATGHRLARGQRATWTTARLKSDRPCQECFQLQHETRGRCGPRRQARKRRRHPEGGVLELCTAHAQLWAERDAADTGSTRR